MAVLGLISATGCTPAHHKLSDPANFKTVQHALRTDQRKLAGDLQLEKTLALSASRHPQQLCYDLRNNVNFVVLKTIRGFVLGVVAADRDDMQGNLDHMRQDKSRFEQDIRDFVNDGVAAPAGAKRAAAAITKEISIAMHNTNRMISRINHGVQKAYAIANGLAPSAGPCKNAGPGTAMPSVDLVT